MAKRYNNFGDKVQRPEQDSGLGGAGSGILGGYAFFNAVNVGSIPTWEYPECLLPKKKKKMKNPIRTHKGSLNARK